MSQHDVKSFYNEISDKYDAHRFRSTYHTDVAKREEQFVVSKLSQSLRQHVLEVGPGTGRFTRHLADLSDSLTVCDISENMLEQVQHRIGPRENVKYHVSSIEAIDALPDCGRYDVTVAMRILSHVPDWEHALQQLWRSVRPGGVLIFDLWNRQSFVGAARKLFRRPSHVLTHRLTRRQIGSAVASLDVEQLDTLRWGYPRMGSVHLDRLGSAVFPTWAYSTVFCCRRVDGAKDRRAIAA